LRGSLQFPLADKRSRQLNFMSPHNDRTAGENPFFHFENQAFHQVSFANNLPQTAGTVGSMKSGGGEVSQFLPNLFHSKQTCSNKTSVKIISFDSP